MIPIKFDMSRLQTAIYIFLHDTDHVADVDDDERCIIYLIMLSALSLSQIMGFMRHLITQTILVDCQNLAIDSIESYVFGQIKNYDH